MTISPYLTFNSLIPSQSYVLSYLSISFNNSTFSNVASNLYLFLILASLTTLLKQSLSSLKATASVLALMVAALGALYNKANSPKASPGW